jgi:hypothetical protein
MLGRKTYMLVKNLRILKLIKFNDAPYIAAQLYGVPHWILGVFNTILYENEFQNPQVFHQHVRFSPERSTLVVNDFINWW